MQNDRLCIICGARKPGYLFEKKGEHIVPRFLGSRKLRTPHVCKECNNGLGGTVDIALKNVRGVALACFDRDVGGVRSKRPRPENRGGAGGALDINKLSAPPHSQPRESDPDVKGAMLKIVYEAAHLRLGNDWLRDPMAAAIRETLFAYVNKDKTAARERASGIPIRNVSADVFYHAIGRSRSELIKRAALSKTCLNALWLVPVITKADCGHSNHSNSLEQSDHPENPAHIATIPAIVYDIEGLQPGCATVGENAWGVNGAELLWPAPPI